MVKVMIVEDDPVFLNRFCRIVTSDPQFELFAAVRDGKSARDCLLNGAPDVLLVDLGLPDVSGIEIIREVSQRYPQTDIMVVTVFGDEEHVIASIEAGATGYLLKDSLPEEFIDVVKALREGGSPISPVIARQLLRRLRPVASTLEEGVTGTGSTSSNAAAAAGGAASRVPASNGMRAAAIEAGVQPGEADMPDVPHFSARESEILALIAKGFSFAEIAGLLQISSHTVTTYVKKIYQKLAVHSRGEAVYEASRMGLVK